MEKVIGGPLSKGVISQIDSRRKILQKINRSDKDLQFLTSKTGWVRMTSGVDFEGSSNLAKSYVLTGGIAQRNGLDSYSTYKEGTGFRPQPGITGVDVTSVGRFGLLKEATVTYNCWDVEQLEDLERLFMRPGYSALLEWGHTLFVTNSGEYDSTPPSVSSFFKPKVRKEDIYSEIERLKVSSSYNYDAILGVIKNFSWSFRADGGYDCTVVLTSLGELVESMQIALDIPSIIPGYKKPVDTSKNVEPTFLQEVIRSLQDSKTVDQLNLQFPSFSTKYREINGEDFPVGEKLQLRVNTYEDNTPERGTFTYISLRMFCGLINMCLLKDSKETNLVHLNTRIRPLESVEKVSNIPTARFRTFKEHTSSDPAVCILGTMESTTFPYGVELINSLRDKRQGSSDEILNIYVNTNLLLNLCNVLVEDPSPENRTLVKLFNPLFSELNYAMGGINELAFHYEDSSSTLYIVDRKVQIEESDLSEIQVTGLGSEVSNFTFTTKVSAALTSTIAISAQAGRVDMGLEAEAMLRWNTGLSSRVITTRSITGEQPSDPKTVEEKQKEFSDEQAGRREVVSKALQQFYHTTPAHYSKKQFLEAKNQYTAYASGYISKIQGQETKLPAGIIPFEVNMEIGGIAGIRQGQAFVIGGNILPPRYKGVVGFIVTGINHKIQNSRWITTLKAQTIIIGSVIGKVSDKLVTPQRTGVKGIVSKPTPNKMKLEYVPTRDKVLQGRSKGLKTLITAHATKEGFYPGTVSYDLKNPGNFRSQVGSVPIAGRGTGSRKGFVKYNSLEDGIKAQVAQVELIQRGESRVYKQNPTLKQYIYSYSPPSENNSEAYIDYMIAFFRKEGMTITRDSRLSEIINLG